MIYNFEWDPNKAQINPKKHKISFDNAATVFKDPKAISIYDDEHSTDEDRWITIGLTASSNLVVVSHLFKQIDENTVIIRIISSRKATKNEEKQYMEEL
ncbi:MAG: BrnT family toxin [bacterium]|nr:BrnT family toxin [bacterium]